MPDSILAANASTSVSKALRISPRAWMILPACALGFLIVTTAIRLRRVEYASEVAGRPEPAPGETPSGPAPEGVWRPGLIVPGHHDESFEWLDETRQMFARGQWRVRHVDYENAPAGHDVYAASPYRWWLGLVASGRQLFLGGPIDRSVERAALYADPLLLVLCLVGTGFFVARRIGVVPAALGSVGLATLFPFASAFVPGVPDDPGLAQICVVWSVLPLVVGVFGAAETGSGPRTRHGFVLAGILGGIGLWVSVATEAPILTGIGLGALIVAWVSRAEAKAAPSGRHPPLPWRAWAFGGAASSLIAYLVEFFPSHLGSWQLRVIHPVFGLAWLGVGEVLARLTAWIGGERPIRNPREGMIVALSVAAVASVPVALRLTRSAGFLTVDLSSMRLSLLPGSVSAPSFLGWLAQNGFTPLVWATLLPALLLLPAIWLLFSRRNLGLLPRAAIGLSLGPVLVAVGFACWQLRWWAAFDGAVLVLLMATAAAVQGSGVKGLGSWLLGAATLAGLLPGALQLWPASGARTENDLTRSEVIGLVERDFADWLVKHEGSTEVVALSPPDATTSLYYYRGIRGLGTFGWENREGLEAAIRITSASTPEEARDLMGHRGVKYIVIPKWDNYLDAYARMGEGEIQGTFIERLHLWHLPPWLRPVPYLTPGIAGFEGQSVIVLEVVEDQDDAMAVIQLAEYFVDMGQLDLAASAGQSLRRFPADLGATLARAEVAVAEGAADEFARDVEVLLRRISSGADRNLPWDEEVKLAIVLAQSHHIDLAQARLQRCLSEADADSLRALSVNTLFRLQMLRRAFGLEIPDPRLQDLAMDLLPSDLRSRLEKNGR
jgi:hypothetical protein